jgi:hypothetical protein
MLTKADMPIETAERLFAPLGLSPAYLAPTSTALAKCIMDATEGVRNMLRVAQLHDFGLQRQGPADKAALDVELHHDGGVSTCIATLYRPQTKSGDPRIWISDLRKHVNAGNLIALLPNGPKLLAIVVSAASVQGRLADTSSILRQRLQALSPGAKFQTTALGVIADLRSIARKGWIPAFRTGPTAVGMTLERALGIMPNPDQAPDYKGFELKAKVLPDDVAEAEHAQTRQTLFAQVPDWKISRMKSSGMIIAYCGYPDSTGTARKRLYCEVSSRKPNSQGLQFKVDHANGHLVEVQRLKDDETEIARWQRERLESKLASKHAQTAWVYARERSIAGQREFRYFHLNLTMAPRTGAFLNLLESGLVSMDHLIKEDLQGQVQEKGPLFKMHARDMPLLFPFRESVPLNPDAPPAC